jgi:hypothetical protein
MKKIILTFLASLFILSCSKNDNQVTTDSGLLCNKKVIKDARGNLISEINFSYNGNKIVNTITNSNGFIYEARYYYTDDLITKVECYSNNTLNSKSNFTYNSQKNLIQIICLDYINNRGDKLIYNYTTDLLITENWYQGDLISQNQLNSTYNITLTKTNGEITSFNKSGTGYQLTNNYFYDSKNHFMKNVLGYGKMNFLFGGDDIGQYNNRNNYCAQNVTQFQTSNNTLGSTPRNVVTLYAYNSNNYPISETQTIYSGGSTTSNDIRNSWYYYN